MSLLEKIQLLPPDKQEYVEDFIEFLLSKYKMYDSSISEDLAEHKGENAENRPNSKIPDNFNDEMK